MNGAVKTSFYRKVFYSTQIRNPYDVLGVRRGSEMSEVKRAYLELVKKYHPDVNPEKKTNEMFIEIQNAYNVLLDEKKRQGQLETDSIMHSDIRHDYTYIREHIKYGLDDLLKEMMKNIRGAFFNQNEKIERDISTKIIVSAKDGKLGVTKKHMIDRIDECDQCNGSGRVNTPEVVVCQTCKGSGNVIISRGNTIIEFTCKDCSLGKKSNTKICNVCNGKGYKSQKVVLNIVIPVGTTENTKLVLHGQGNLFRGKRGSVNVSINITNSS